MEIPREHSMLVKLKFDAYITEIMKEKRKFFRVSSKT